MVSVSNFRKIGPTCLCSLEFPELGEGAARKELLDSVLKLGALFITFDCSHDDNDDVQGDSDGSQYLETRYGSLMAAYDRERAYKPWWL